MQYDEEVQPEDILCGADPVDEGIAVIQPHGFDIYVPLIAEKWR
jgi:hypothetical protein